MWYLWAFFQVKILAPLIQMFQVLIIIVSSVLFNNNYYPNHNVADGTTFDFVVIGGGAAGCVVANRLTEISDWNVLLIEAGDDPPNLSEIPGISVLLGSSFPDWNYYTVDNGVTAQAQKTRHIHQVSGKLLGGSSSVNYMYYVRGNRADFENWTPNNTNWNWNTVIKYFKKSEHFTGGHNSPSEFVLHGKHGYLGVTEPIWEKETKNYFKAFQEIGHNILDDINGFEQLGYSSPSYTIGNEKRQSSAFAFIRPIKERPNLFLLKKTIARKIVFDGKRAVSIEIENSRGIIKKVNARKEIILSAGAVNSPQLLMLSGIGPKQHLQDIGVKTLLDSPSVGGNLQDHILVPIMLARNNTEQSLIENLKFLTHFDRFPAATIMGHIALDRNQIVPDYQVTAFPFPRGTIFPILMCSSVFKWNDDVCVAMAESTNQETLFALISFLHPKSRGKIRLQSSNPHHNPLIYPIHFSNAEDISKFARCIMDFTKIINTTYFKEVNSEIVNLKVQQCAGIPFASQEYWECYVINMVASQFHLSGTCAMGEDGVVDENLKVRGVEGLRVVDASVMPKIVSGNTYATVVMIGERGSDIIKSDHGVKTL